jgi:hypothetical protein
MELELLRHYFSEGTNGTLACNGIIICATIELPWKNNSARISCIPEGRYRLVKRYSPKFRNHYLVNDVPYRQYILIHPANNAKTELKGCIAPVSIITGIGQGALSLQAMQHLNSYLLRAFERNETVFITIKKNDHEKNSQQVTTTNTGVF